MKAESMFDRAIERLLQLSGGRIIEVAIALLGVGVLVVVVPAYSALTFAIFDASTELFLRVLIAFEAASVVGVGVSAVLMLVRTRPIRQWSGGDHGVDAARAAHGWVLTGVPTLAKQICAVMVVTEMPPGLYIGQHIGMSLLGQVSYLVLLGLLVIGATVFVYLVFEQILGRVLADVHAAHDLSDASDRGVSLQAKVLVLVPVISLYAGIVIASTNTNSLDRDQGLALAVGVSLLISATAAVVMTFLFRRSLFDRLDSLRHALGLVAAGDFDTRLTSIHGDELDDVARGYNEMVGQLAGHVAALRDSRARIVAAADESRREIERNLHDGAQQYLVLMDLKLGQLARAAAEDPGLSFKAAEIREDLRNALAELRDLAHGLFPAVLESDGLAEALEVAGKRTGLDVTVDPGGVGRLPSEMEAAVYFCCLEAMQNAAKHAGDGARLAVALAHDDGSLRFSVADDGAGYDASVVGMSHGLQNMTDRIGAIGGQLSIESRPGEGTTVAGTVPLP